MPTWCAPCLRKNPQLWSRAVAFRDDKHLCKECLHELYPETKPAPSLADIAREAFGEKPAPAEPTATKPAANIGAIALKLKADGLSREDARSAPVNMGFTAFEAINATRKVFEQQAGPAKIEELKQEEATMAKKCACGCGKDASEGREYAWGHKPKNGGASPKPAKPAVASELPAKATGSRYAPAIADLRAKAQKLNEIADELEAM